MSRFAAMKNNAANAAPDPQQAQTVTTTGRQANRIGRKAIAGYFSEEMAIAMKVTATKNGKTLQEAMAEAFDLWLRQHGESPIGG